MEDPIAFDLWAAFGPGMESEVRQLLQKANPETPRFALLKSTTRGTAGREWIPVVEELGWEEVQAWKAEADRGGTTEVFQSGYGPSDDERLYRCPKHGLRYAGRLGCPVCGGWARR